MWVDHAEVEWRKGDVRVRERNEHGTVDGWVASVCGDVGLDSHARIPRDIRQGRVCQVQLRNPSNEFRSASCSRSDVAVVWTDGLARCFPGEVNFTTGIREWYAAVVGYSGGAILADGVVVEARLGSRDDGGVESVLAGVDGLVKTGLRGVAAGWVRLVENAQRGEILPCETCLVRGAGADVGSEQRPSPGLGDTGLEPDGHREETVELTEDHLLPCLGGDGLEEQLCSFTRV